MVRFFPFSWIFITEINKGEQGFIQALLLTSVFHERLSFIAAGHNPVCVSTLAITTGDSYGEL